MKFILIAAVALLALAQGSFAQGTAEVEKLSQYFEELKTKLTRDLAEVINNQDLASQAQTFFNERVRPVVAQVQEQLKAASANVEEQVRPLASSMQDQVEPMITNFQEQMEAMVKKLMDQTQALGN